MGASTSPELDATTGGNERRKSLAATSALALRSKISRELGSRPFFSVASLVDKVAVCSRLVESSVHNHISRQTDASDRIATCFMMMVDSPKKHSIY